ncbi:MAG: hypothetical protein ACJ8GN_07140 [Longimicrobiaceae bacterium]
MEKFAQLDVTGTVEIKPGDKADLIRVTTGESFDGEVILPSASSVLGRRYTIRRVAGPGSIFVVLTDGNDTINGQGDFTMASSSASTPVTFQAVKTGPAAFGYEIV